MFLLTVMHLSHITFTLGTHSENVDLCQDQTPVLPSVQLNSGMTYLIIYAMQPVLLPSVKR